MNKALFLRFQINVATLLKTQHDELYKFSGGESVYSWTSSQWKFLFKFQFKFLLSFIF